MSKYAEIIERLEKSIDGDYELAAAVMVASGAYVLEKRKSGRRHWLYPTFQNYGRINPVFYGEGYKNPLRYIDAAIELVNRTLPGSSLMLDTRFKPACKILPPLQISSPDPKSEAATLPLAILVELFRGLEAQDGEA